MGARKALNIYSEFQGRCYLRHSKLDIHYPKSNLVFLVSRPISFPKIVEHSLKTFRVFLAGGNGLGYLSYWHTNERQENSGETHRDCVIKSIRHKRDILRDTNGYWDITAVTTLKAVSSKAAGSRLQRTTLFIALFPEGCCCPSVVISVS